ncbi:hypothetical protein GF318_00425 [Candidatus Micrarchaeota archaeon]|nr:hypothetical protein [Candidatus Micrarchaeota archaeon]
MTIRKNIYRSVNRVEGSWRKIERARCDMSSGVIRRAIFARSKRSSDELYEEAKRMMPGHMERDSASEAIESREHEQLYLLGGLARVLNSARSTSEKLGAVEQAFEEDLAGIDFRELEKREKKLKPVDILLSAGKWISLAVAGIGMAVSLYAGKASDSTEIYNRGLFVSVGSLGCHVLLGIVQEKFNEYFKPGLKKIQRIISNMKEGLAGLRNDLRELQNNTSFFSRQ